jgi:hypothetical protein
LKAKDKRAATKALCSGRGTQKVGNSRIRHAAAPVLEAVKQKKSQASIANIDDVERLTEFDFLERYRVTEGSKKAAMERWQQARSGDFPPWVPCTSRGAPAVAKLRPEIVRASRTEIAEITRAAKGNKLKMPVSTRADEDCSDLLPRGTSSQAPLPEPAAASEVCLNNSPKI